MSTKRHGGCVICGQYHRYKLEVEDQANKQQAANQRKIRAVYSACLTAKGPWTRESVRTSKNPQELVTPGGSTHPNLTPSETSGRYAKSAT